MNTVIRTTTCALSLAVASAVYAGENSDMQHTSNKAHSAQLQDRAESSGQMPAKQTSQTGISLDDQMLGQQVKNKEGKSLGKIEDAVIDAYGRVQYVMISPSGSVDTQDDYLVVPWHAFSEMQDGNWILPLAEDKLTSAPTFTRDQIRANDLDMPENITIIYAFYDLPEPGQQTVQFSRLDSNNDGYVSKTEAQQSNQLQARFKKVDDNGDGRIDRSEFSAFEIVPQDSQSSRMHKQSMNEN